MENAGGEPFVLSFAAALDGLCNFFQSLGQALPSWYTDSDPKVQPMLEISSTLKILRSPAFGRNLKLSGSYLSLNKNFP